MLGNAVLEAAVNHAQAEEQHAPALANAALHHGDDGQVVGYLEP